MRLRRARIQYYRSIKDSSWFEVEHDKTILVGPNESGKTALLRALEHVSPGPLVKSLEPLRDYPRSEYHQFQARTLKPRDVVVAEVEFELDEEDREAVAEISPDFSGCSYGYWRRLDNSATHFLIGAPERALVGHAKDAMRRLATHAESRQRPAKSQAAAVKSASEELDELLSDWADNTPMTSRHVEELDAWLDSVLPQIDESDEEHTSLAQELREAAATSCAHDQVLSLLQDRRPTLIYFSNYTRVRPVVHLEHLAEAMDTGAVDEADTYNFGNACLLRFLNFSARELSDLGRPPEPSAGDPESFERYRAQLDERDAILNAASLRLTQQIKEVWQPNTDRGGEDSDYTVRIRADQQYLKVVVEDSPGVEVELDQRSEGFQWLVSFLIVFFAQASDRLRNAVLLLDEPGLSLHGLKQSEFRHTLSRLAQSNQLLFTTHSPFMVGPEELDKVRVVEMVSRSAGTKVHTGMVAEDPGTLLPLQEALGYSMAQSLFTQKRNLVLQRLTDHWYLEATAELLRAAGVADLDESIELLPASGDGKLVYFATLLHAQQVRVAALLDSEAAGDRAARQDTLVNALGNKRILRTKDSYGGPVGCPELEDLLRNTLVSVGRTEMGFDVASEAAAQSSKPITTVFSEKFGSTFSRYELAKAYMRWTRSHYASDLSAEERDQWKTLINSINLALDSV